MKRTIALLSVLFSTLAFGALNYEFNGAHVLGIEATHMPATIVFKIDKTFANTHQCPTGTLIYTGNSVENTKAILTLLTTAYLSGRPLYLVADTANMNYGPGLCRVTFVGLGTPL